MKDKNEKVCNEELMAETLEKKVNDLPICKNEKPDETLKGLLEGVSVLDKAIALGPESELAHEVFNKIISVNPVWNEALNMLVLTCLSMQREQYVLFDIAERASCSDDETRNKWRNVLKDGWSEEMPEGGLG